jgi:hypothetical protein
MAKITGPLLSIGARGAIGKTLVAAEWKGQKYMRQYVIPANPRTTEQTVTRNTFSMLNGFWLVAPALARAPWTANAVGQRYTDRNKVIAENMPALRNELDMANFIGSPGALGGPPLESISVSTGTTPGGVDVTATPGTAPSGWTLEGVVFMAFPDQDPADPFGGPIIVLEDTTSTFGGNLAGLGNATPVIVTAWPRWTRPDARVAYGASLVDTGTTDSP